MVSFDDLIPKQEKAPPSRGRTALEQGLQGATFNLADEVYNRLGALGAYGYQALTDMPTESQDPRVAGLNLGAVGRGINSLQDLTNVASQDTNRRLAEQLQERPALSIGSNIAGALLTGGAGATTNGGTAIANSLRSGGLGLRAAKAGLLGAASGATAGFGAGSGLEDRLDKSGGSAVAGGLVGGAIPVVGAVAGKVTGGIKKEAQSLAKALPETSSALRAKAKPLFDKFTQSGASYSPKLTNEIADLADSLKVTGIAGKLKPEDEAFNNVLNYYSGLRGAELSPTELQALDQSFADDIARLNIKGEKNFGRILNDLKYEMRNRAFDPQKAASYVSSGSPDAIESLKQGNKLWSQSYKTADIEKIISKAKGTENPQTSIRTGLKNLLANEKKMANYSQEEKAVLEEALKRGVTGGLIKLFGGRLTDSVAGSIAGFSAGGPVGAIAGAVAGKAIGGVMADVAGGIQANRVRGALQSIQSGAKGGLPAVVGNSGKLALPAGELAGTISAKKPTQIEINPNQPNPYKQELPQVNLPQLNFNDLIPQAPMAPQSSLKERIGGAESGNNPNASNPNSTATGLYGFTDPTWKSAVDKWGRSKGIKYSDKNDPQKQAMMMDYLLKDNARILQNKGIETSDANLYFAHFLGAPAASKAIQMLGKNAIAARSFPKAAQANPEVFFDGKRPRTIDEVYELITSKVV